MASTNTHSNTESSGTGSKIGLVLLGAVLIIVGVVLNGQAEENAGLRSAIEPAMFAGLGLNFAKVIINVGLFLLFIQVINSFFYAPLKEAMDERNRDLQSTFTDADNLRAEMTKMRSDYEQRLAATEAQAREQIQSQIREAQNLRATLMDEATQKTNALVAQAQQEITAERDRLIGDLRNHVVDLALAAAEKVVRENMDTDRNRRMVEDFVNQAEAVH